MPSVTPPNLHSTKVRLKRAHDFSAFVRDTLFTFH